MWLPLVRISGNLKTNSSRYTSTITPLRFDSNCKDVIAGRKLSSKDPAAVCKIWLSDKIGIWTNSKSCKRFNFVTKFRPTEKFFKKVHFFHENQNIDGSNETRVLKPKRMFLKSIIHRCFEIRKLKKYYSIIHHSQYARSFHIITKNLEMEFSNTFNPNSLNAS